MKIRHLQKMKSLGQLTGGVAHDFNNMLAVVIGGLGVAKRRLEKGDSNIQSLIDGALDGAHRAAALTKRLLAFSRQQPLEPQLVSANKLVSGMSEMIARTLGGTIRTETVLAGGLWTIHADSSELESALLNLCVNARDAMNEGGRLTIETANGHLDDAYATAHTEVAAGQYVMIAVSDTGSGMTPETAAKAFDLFFRRRAQEKVQALACPRCTVSSSSQEDISRSIRSRATAQPSRCIFHRVYRADTDINTVSKGSEVKRLPMGKADQLILVVEDDAKVREVTLSMLRDLGYSTIHAEGAGTALRQLDDHPNVTLLFTDIVMPDVNGRKLADEALKRRPELKVLFTTGFTKNAVVHNGVLDAGVQLLQKPFSIEELASKIKVLLSARDLSDTGVPH